MRMQDLKNKGNIAGKYLIFTGLLLVAIRSFAIEFFDVKINNNFVVPASLITEPEEEEFQFVVVSDTGAKNAPIERIIKTVQNDSANKFIVHLGDLVRYRNISHFRWILSELDEKLQLPWHMIPGNHEIENRMRYVDKSLYKAMFGPLYYWFSYGETIFIGLDSSEGTYSRQQLEWLDNVLSHIRPHFKYCIVYTHIPPFANEEWKKKMAYGHSVSELREMLAKNNVNLVLAGHVHEYSEGIYNGVRMVTLMSSGQKVRSSVKQFGYVTVHITAEGIEVAPHYLADNMEKDNEYVELLLSSVLVDERLLAIAISILVVGILLFVICNRLRA